MAIRDCSNLPDDRVPDWVRRKRENKRKAEKRRREAQEYWDTYLRDLDVKKLAEEQEKAKLEDIAP